MKIRTTGKICRAAVLVLAAALSLSSCDKVNLGENMGSFIYDIKYTFRSLRNRPEKAESSRPRRPRRCEIHDTIYIGKELPDTLSVPDADCLFIEARDSVVITEKSAAMIVVDKEKMTLAVLDFKSDTLFSCRMGCGRQYGDKQELTDDRTPEGIFKVRRIEDSSAWSHKTKTGLTEYGVYGQRFIRLELPPRHAIGIHGTNDPRTLGTRSSEGCVRVSNANIIRIASLAYPGMPVVILPSKADSEANAKFFMQQN